MKVWIGLSPNDVQGMEFNLTPLELRDLIGKPNWVPTKFLGWRTWKTSVYFKILLDMEIHERKAVSDELKKYDHLAKDSDFIEVTEWANGEGWDICLNDKLISLTYGQLEAIKYLVKALDYNR